MSSGTIFAAAIPFIVVGGAIALFYVVFIIPLPIDKYDRAVVIKICRDGSRIFRMEDGSYETLRPGAFRGYRVESPKEVCG